jgi:hypothetical protein
MSYKYTLTLIGLILIWFGLVERGWWLLPIWLGGNFLILGLAHWRSSHGIFGKRPDGTISFWRRVAFLPLLAYTAAVWHLMRICSREQAQNMVADNVVVGRRLLPPELEGEFVNYIDLTAEFAEPSAIRLLPSYSSFPILDGAAPTPYALRRAVACLRPGRTFIHCAQGHGRTGLFALAVLLTSGVVLNVEDGLRMLTTVRPAIRLNSDQQKCIQMYAKHFSV